MQNRRIKNVESTSIGKCPGKNDDDIYIGENYAVVIDGVSNKSTIERDGKNIGVANIITEAIRKLDGKHAPNYAKELEFEKFTDWVNLYIKKYCEHIGYDLSKDPLEATGAIYSRVHNQIWLVGDCRAIYDGKVIQNELKIDEIYAELRARIINILLENGYTERDLFKRDISKEFIKEPEKIPEVIQDKSVMQKIEETIQTTMHETLLKCGFSEEEIEEGNLLQKYNTPKKLQEYFKNNPNANEYGYSVFNGIKTESKNCIVQDLPEDVRHIRLFSDGFPVEILNNDKDLGYAIRANRRLAEIDPLCINENRGVKGTSKQTQREDNILAFDDASAVDIMIERIEERDDER